MSTTKDDVLVRSVTPSMALRKRLPKRRMIQTIDGNYSHNNTEIMKQVKAVKPYIYKGKINFKHKPFEAWKAMELPVAKSHYPWRWLHGLVFKYDFPCFGWIKNHLHKDEARLRFVQPCSLSFDTWPDYIFYEVIPFFWDVWPMYDDMLVRWRQGISNGKNNK